MIDKIRTDSLDARRKYDLVLGETTKFVQGSAHVQNGIHYLMSLFGVWVVVEFCFMVMQKRGYGIKP